MPPLPDDAEQSQADAPWWRGAAIYQIYPRSFADSNGDGIGDLPGITAHLDHVARLGVDAIWISPFFVSPQADFGYDVSDYRAIDPQYGTLADCDALIARAHALGLRVVVDMVWSHTSDRHAWFAQSRTDAANPHADWYVWADPKPDGTPPSNWQSVFGGPAWTWDARRGQYYLHTFLKEQPQLNVRLPAVQDALLDVARFWIARGVDGFRLDAINHAIVDDALTDNPPAPPSAQPRTRPYDYQEQRYTLSRPEMLPFLDRIGALMTEAGDRFTVAEVGGPDSAAIRRTYTAPGRLGTAYGFDFLYAPALTAETVRRALASWPNAPEAGWPSWAFENHDAPRAVTRWTDPAHADAFARMKMLLLACLRGTIFLYQGEELGLPQANVAFEDLKDPEAIANWPRTLGRDGARTPMPWRGEAAALGFTTGRAWLPADPAHAGHAVDQQEADAGSMLHHSRAVLALRRAHRALRHGTLTMVGGDPDVLVFDRAWNGEHLRCTFNLGARERAWSMEGEPLFLVGQVTLGLLAPYAATICRLPR